MLFLSNVGFFQGDISNSTTNKLAHLARYSEKQWVRVLLGEHIYSAPFSQNI